MYNAGIILLSDRLLLYVVTKRTTASSLITTYLKILKTSIVYIMKMPLQKRYYSELPITKQILRICVWDE